MALKIDFGHVSLSGSNIATVSFGPFAGTPSVTATIVGVEKNGPTVCIKKRSGSSATFAAFYNGGLELKEGTIDWIAIGTEPSRQHICGCIPGGHTCLNNVWD